MFFSSMYRAMSRGVSLGEAVTAAKREGIRRGAPPAAWADVVLLGDAEVRPRARETGALVPLAVAGAVLALVGIGAERRRRWNRRWRLRRRASGASADVQGAHLR